MDQKHSMMYPSVTSRSGETSSTSHRNHEMGTEAPPPSYDIAIASAPPETVPSTSSAQIGFQQPPSIVIPVQESYNSHPIQHPVIVESTEPIKLGPRPSKVTCPECGERRRTRMHFTSNRKTHIFAVILCLLGWCCCACTVPYCMRSCKTGHHYCAKCNRFLGSYDRNDS